MEKCIIIESGGCSTWYLRRRKNPGDRVVLDWAVYPLIGNPGEPLIFQTPQAAWDFASAIGLTGYKLEALK